VAHGNDKGASGKARQFRVPALDRAVAKGKAGSGRIVIQECDTFEQSGAAGSVENDLAVTPSAPDE
jgi:hypothetical protein